MSDLSNLQWRKSSFSDANQACVEVASLGVHHAVRDSKNPAGPALRFSTAEWSTFITGIRSGEFD